MPGYNKHSLDTSLSSPLAQLMRAVKIMTLIICIFMAGSPVNIIRYQKTPTIYKRKIFDILDLIFEW